MGPGVFSASRTGGSSSTPHASRLTPHHPTRGFTLIELLVVLVIIGITAAMIAINLAPDPRQALETEAQRLALLLQQARDEAMTSGTRIAFSAEKQEFRFWQKPASSAEKAGETARTWEPHADQELYKPRSLAGNIRVEEMRINQQPVDSHVQKIVFTPSGMTLPFRITLSDGALRIAISGNAIGQIEVDKDSSRS
ncbi:MAG: type II secretion system protein GspH [Nitrosomonadales bacterium]|nr:MAG: type II secretion system protein GspH [Nitrosomonadales bacterium]